MTNATQAPTEIHPLSRDPHTRATYSSVFETLGDPTITDERVFEEYIKARYGFDSLFTMSLLDAIQHQARAANKPFVRGRIERRNDAGERIGPLCYINSDAMILVENVIIDTFVSIRTHTCPEV